MAGLDPGTLAQARPSWPGSWRNSRRNCTAEKLADRAAVMRIAIEPERPPAAGPGALLLDVPVWTTLEAQLVAQLAAARPTTLTTVPAGDRRTLRAAAAARARCHARRPTNRRRVRSAACRRRCSPKARARLRHAGTRWCSCRRRGKAASASRSRAGSCARPSGRPVRSHGHLAARAGAVPRPPAGGAAPGAHAGALRQRRGPARSGRPRLPGAARLPGRGAVGAPFRRIPVAGRGPRRDRAERAPRRRPGHRPLGAARRGAAARRRSRASDGRTQRRTRASRSRARPRRASRQRRGGGGDPAAPRRWEQILVEAAVIGGRDRWQRRLAGWREELGCVCTSARTTRRAAKASSASIAELDALAAFALPLLDELAALPAAAPWGEWLDSLARAGDPRAAPARARAVGARRACARWRRWARWDCARCGWCSRRRLADLVWRPPGRARRPGLRRPGTTARGLAFDVVFVPGLAERMFPQKVTEDPLLRDEARRRSGSSSPPPTIASRPSGWRCGSRWARAPARVVLSYSAPRRRAGPAARAVVLRPRGAARRRGQAAQLRRSWRGAPTRQRHPHRLAGARRIPPTRSTRPSTTWRCSTDWSGRQPRGAETVGAARYLSPRTRTWRAPCATGPRLDPNRWSYADGLVKPDEAARAALPAHALGGALVLADGAAELRRLSLPLRPARHPQARAARGAGGHRARSTPLDKGSLVHEVQFELLSELRERGLVPISAGQLRPRPRGTLDRVLERVAARYKDKLAPAIERVWDDGIASIRADLREWLRRESRAPALDAAGSSSWPSASPKRAAAIPAATRRAGRPRLRHQPARIDRSGRGARPTARLRATDYKTGKRTPAARRGDRRRGDPAAGALRPGAREALPRAPVAGGRLYYCTSAGDFKEVMVPLDRCAPARPPPRWPHALGQALSRGFLPAAPHKGACRYCDYRADLRPVGGGAHRARRSDRRQLQALEALRRLP